MATEATNNGGSTANPLPDASVKVENSDAPSQQPPPSAATPASNPPPEKRWPGWPGDSVYRLIVPVAKVGSIIGKKGELIKRICEETKARIRILDGVQGTTDRIVLISGKEEPEAHLSPAMNAVLRVFKRINGLSETEGVGTDTSAAGGAACSIRLLVASSQAINLIGKQGSLIKSIQESSTASIRVLSGDEVPFYATSDERVIDIQGESQKVLKALEAVVGHLRKFLVDHSVIPLFEKVKTAADSQDHALESWLDKAPSLVHTAQTAMNSDYSFPPKIDSLYRDRDSRLESQMQHSGLSLYGQDTGLSGLRSSGLTRTSAPLITQMTQSMQIPLSYAEDIIGIGGSNIAYIRRSSGAILTVQESRGMPDEITVEIKGTSTQVQSAQQLIQDVIAGHREPVASNYGKIDSGLRSYSQYGNPSYSSSSYSAQGLGGGYGSSGLGGYSNYRL